MSSYRGHSWLVVKKSIKLLGNKCQKCGSNKHVYTHHIDGNPRNNHPDNWRRMCAKCHKRLHSKYYGLSKNEKNNIIKSRTMEYAIKSGHRVRIPIGYIKTGDAMRILDVSRETINNYAESRYGGIRIYSGRFPNGRGVYVYPKEHILEISRLSSK